MAFDECTPYPATRQLAATGVRRTLSWMERCITAHARADQPLRIVQGSTFRASRAVRTRAGRHGLSRLRETSSLGVRSAAERWGIVRTGEERLAFVGRRKIPASLDQPPVDLELRQDLRAGKLESFEVHLRTAKHHLEVKGILVAGMMRVERRADEMFIDLQSTHETIAAVDVGSVSTMMLLAHVRAGGKRFSLLRFHEALELEVIPWSLELDSTAGHLFATPEGPKYATFEGSGALQLLREQQGSGTSETVSVTEIAVPGLPLSEAKLKLLATGAAEAAAPKPEQEEPQKKERKEKEQEQQ